MQNKKISIILILTLISIAAAIYLGFFAFTKPAMEDWYQKLTFYFILAAFGLWLQRLIPEKIELSVIIAGCKKHLAGIIVAASIVTFGFMSSTPEYRILADETNLLGMAAAMYDEHKTYNPTEVMYYHHGKRREISRVTDMRPAFFPFLVYLAHTVLGYSPQNGFVINAIAAFALLFLFYYLLQRYLNCFWAVIGQLCIGAFPLFILYMTSSGFEIVNLLYALLLFLFIDDYLKNKNAQTAEIVFLTLPLLAQTRYESALSVFIVIPLVLWYLPKKEYWRLTMRTVLVPFLFVPVAWLRIITFNSGAFQVASVEKAFGFDHFVTNIKKAVPFFLGNSNAYGMLPLIGTFACIGFCWVVWDLFDTDKELNENIYPLGFTIFCFFLVHACARFFYYWGNMTLQYTSRLGIIFLPLLAMLSVYLFRKLTDIKLISKSFVTVGVTLIALHSWPVAGNNLAVRDILFFREFKFVREFLEKNSPDKSRYVLVSDLSNFYTPFRYSAINCHYLNSNRKDLESQLLQKRYQKILVVQKLNAKTDMPLPGSILKGDLNLNPVFETQLTPGKTLRISELKFPLPDNG
jgi:hypothetical protein